MLVQSTMLRLWTELHLADVILSHGVNKTYDTGQTLNQFKYRDIAKRFLFEV